MLKPLRSKAPPFWTIVPAAVAPKAEEFASCRMPLEIVVVPEYELAPLRTRMPAPICCTLPEPVMTSDTGGNVAAVKSQSGVVGYRAGAQASGGAATADLKHAVVDKGLSRIGIIRDAVKNERSGPVFCQCAGIENLAGKGGVAVSFDKQKSPV